MPLLSPNGGSGVGSNGLWWSDRSGHHEFNRIDVLQQQLNPILITPRDAAEPAIPPANSTTAAEPADWGNSSPAYVTTLLTASPSILHAPGDEQNLRLDGQTYRKPGWPLAA
ncbi:hypothetical protein AB5N19_00513 [Seiridium cardinale]|uniref:Uncharacterized protein n=1 Tax=Seiridium cardinale TaxID=138064 RepID=A0ABR2XWY0_9PEZI